MQFTKLKALSAAEWKVLIASLLLLPYIALVLRLKGFKWTRNFMQNRIPQTKDTGPAEESSPAELQNRLATAQSVARMVSIAANHGLYRANCLKRSLATWWLLQRRGISTELNIGVNKDDGAFNAHAWVEYMGHTLVEADDVKEKFSTFGPQ